MESWLGLPTSCFVSRNCYFPLVKHQSGGLCPEEPVTQVELTADSALSSALPISHPVLIGHLCCLLYSSQVATRRISLSRRTCCWTTQTLADHKLAGMGHWAILSPVFTRFDNFVYMLLFNYLCKIVWAANLEPPIVLDSRSGLVFMCFFLCTYHQMVDTQYYLYASVSVGHRVNMLFSLSRVWQYNQLIR